MKLTASEAIMREAMRATGLSREQLRARDRTRKVSLTRQAMMFVLRQRTTLSTPQIAEFLGLNDHTTVVHGIQKMREMVLTDQFIHALVNRLLNASTDLDAGDVGGRVFDPTYNRKRRVPPPSMLSKATRATVTMELVARPKPPEPSYERIHIDGGRFILLDERGECDVQRRTRGNMIAGSQRLADAINKVRPAA